MSSDPAVQQAPSKKRSQRKRAKKAPETVEVEINGRKVQAAKQTVPTGAGSISHFFSDLFG
jgi:hypothetical protein